MSRVLKLIGVLMVIAVMSTVSIQPAYATVDEEPIAVGEESNGQDVIQNCNGPVGGGEGDPDTVGGGYGAQSGESDLGGILGGPLGGLGETDDFIEELIRFMLTQFIPVP